MKFSYITPHLGPKGVETPVFGDFKDITQLSLLEKIHIEYILQFNKKLDYNPNNGVFQSILKWDQKSLEKSGPNYKDEQGNTPLMVAAQSGQLNIVQSLKSLGACFDSRTNDGKTALYVATVYERSNIVKWLASNGADVNTADESGTSPLLVSAYQGNYETTVHLIQNDAEINWKDKKGRTPLMAASQQGHVRIVQLLIEKRVDTIIQKSDSGKSALFYAGMKGHNEVVKILIRTKPELVNHQDTSGITVLAACSLHNNITMVKLLCSLGADLNISDNVGRTPIFAGIEARNLKIVEFLASQGASLKIKTIQGKTPLIYAVSLQFHAIVEFIVAHECNNIDDGDENGDTPLTIAASIGNVHLVNLLLNASACVNVQNKDGKSALMCAVVKEHLDIVNVLIERGADVNLKSNTRMTALDVALMRGGKLFIDCLKNAGAKSFLSSEEKSEQLYVASATGSLHRIKTLLGEGADPNYRDLKGCTPTMLASQGGFMDINHSLFSYGARVNQQNENGVSALAYAIEAKHIKVVDFLFGMGADIYLEDNEGKTLLYNCAENGHIEKLKEIVMLGFNVNHRSKGKTPLTVASEKGHFNIVSYLIKMGANPELTSSDGFRAIDYAFLNDHVRIQDLLSQYKPQISEDNDLGELFLIACAKSDIQAISRMLHIGVSVNFQNKENRATPLIIASRYGHFAVVELLCSNGANVNFRTFTDGDTALIIASLNGYVDIVAFLIENGACVNMGDNAGRTSLICASQNGHDQVVNCLIDKGALLNMKNVNGLSAFAYACNNGNIHIVERLVQLSVHIDSPDSEGLTPLIKSSLNGFLPIVEVLVEHGADINYNDTHGRSPLMAASQAGHLSVVKYLVQRGANINLVTITGMTARDYAFVNSHPEVSHWLEENGAKPGVGDKLKRNRDRSKRGFGITSTVPIKQAQKGDVVKKENMNPGPEQEAQKQLIDMCEKGWGFEDSVSYAILKGANVNLPNEKGLTPLLLALQGGHSKHAKWLLQMGADVNVTDKVSVTPLMYASKIGDLELVEKMVELDCNLKLLDPKGHDALFYAQQAGNDLVSAYLLKCIHGNSHQTLIAAIEEGDVSRTKLVLQEGVNLNQKDEKGKSYLFHCVLSVNSSQMVDLLCKQGAEVNTQDQNGDTPLLMCIRHSDVETLRILLGYGANIFICNNFDQNALLETCIRGNIEMLQVILMQTGSFNEDLISKAFIYSMCSNDELVFQLLAQYFSKTVKKLLSNEGIVYKTSRHMLAYLLENDYFSICDEINIVLNCIIDEGERSLVEMLCKRTDITAQTCSTAVFLALVQGRYDTAEFVLEITRSSRIPCILKEEHNYFVCDIDTVPVSHGDQTATCYDETMKSVYKIFTGIIIRESPKCIKGFSRDWYKPVIYINVANGDVVSATQFIKEKVMKDNRMNVVTFEYREIQSKTKYLMQSSSGGNTTKVASGSIVFETDSINKQKLLKGRIKKGNIDNNFGTLACFMQRHDNEMVDSSLWGLTAGHLFIPEIQGPTYLLSEHYDETTNNLKICELANEYEAAIDIIETEENYASVDVATFPVSKSTQRSDLCSVNIEGIKHVPDVFRSNDLLNRRVYKIGHVTGRTEGVVKDADLGINIGEDYLCGMFLVEPCDRSKPFALVGDSGSAVIDLNQGYVLGLICAVTDVISNNCRINLVYCTRFDLALQYAQEKWNIVLSFNEDSEAFSNSRMVDAGQSDRLKYKELQLKDECEAERRKQSEVNDDQSVRCKCELEHEVLELKDKFEAERRKRSDIETKLLNIQCKTSKDKKQSEMIIVKLQKENNTLQQYIEELEAKLKRSNGGGK